VKANLKQLGLRLADAAIQQQCSLGIGVGRTDLICLDEHDDLRDSQTKLLFCLLRSVVTSCEIVSDRDS
jgi:hypothetical protein